MFLKLFFYVQLNFATVLLSYSCRGHTSVTARTHGWKIANSATNYLSMLTENNIHVQHDPIDKGVGHVRYLSRSVP